MTSTDRHAETPRPTPRRMPTARPVVVDLAIARLEESLATALPDDYDLLVDNLEQILDASRPGARGMRT